jgi:hypothetical protein
MKIVKTLLFSILIVSLSVPKGLAAADCPEIKPEAAIKHTTSGLDNGEVAISIENKDQYTVFVFGPDENRLNLKEFKIIGLKRGDYNIVVQDKKGCNKRLSIKIN